MELETWDMAPRHPVLHVPCPMFRAPCPVFHVPCSMFHVPCSVSPVSCLLSQTRKSTNGTMKIAAMNAPNARRPCVMWLATLMIAAEYGL